MERGSAVHTWRVRRQQRATTVPIGTARAKRSESIDNRAQRMASGEAASEKLGVEPECGRDRSELTGLSSGVGWRLLNEISWAY